MEQVPTTISRRKLALGGPAAVALAPFAPIAHLAKLAPLGAVAALGAVHNSAAAAAATTVTTLGGFKTAYARIQNDLNSRVIEAARALHPNSNTLLLSENHDKLHDFFTGLTSTQIQAIRAKAKSELEYIYKNSSTDTDRYARGITYNNAKKYISDISTTTHLNWIRQHHHKVWIRMVLFAKFIFTSTEHQELEVRMAEHEAVSDIRHLVGAYPPGITRTKDRLEDKQTVVAGQVKESVVKLGNFRKTVERHELVRTNHWLMALIWGPKFTLDSEIKHGTNSTSIEQPYITAYTSNAYTLSEDQLTGIKYYTERDIDQNREIAGFTVKDSRRVLYEATLFMANETGYVYESYLAAQLLTRCAGQGAICATRFALEQKYIDLKALAESGISLVQEISEISSLYDLLDENGRIALTAAITALAMILATGIVLTLVVNDKAKEVVKNNKNNNTTAADDVYGTLDALDAAFMGVNFVVQVYSLGVLGYVGLTGYEISDENMAQIPINFARVDLTVPVSEVVAVFRSGTQGTYQGGFTIAAASFRLLGSMYTFAIHPFIKQISWMGSAYTPLQVNTRLSFASSVFYFLAFACVVARVR